LANFYENKVLKMLRLLLGNGGSFVILLPQVLFL